MLKATVFDFDGVIADSEPLHYAAFVNITQPMGVWFDYAEYVEKYLGYDDRDFFRLILAERLAQPALANDEAHIQTLCQQKQHAFENVVADGVKPIPGAIELVRNLANAMPIAIASGATRRDITIILETLSLSPLFSIIITADDVPRSKPDPMTYALAANALSDAHPELDIKPADCLAIEDTAAGITSARNAGLLTLGVTTTGPAHALHQAHRVVQSLTDVNLQKLRQWFDDGHSANNPTNSDTL